jgi:4'-phosphopantetheinyl transferase
MSVVQGACGWCAPVRSLALGAADVHVWRAALADETADMQQLGELLSADEKERAERFRFQLDRERFLMARGILRIILSRYLNQKPQALRFTYNRFGKPALESAGADALHFNLSHSDGLALYAVTRRRELGIDVERIRSERAHKQIAERFFSPHEVAALRGLPRSVQAQAFFNCWTRKEAYIKATGRGLGSALHRFSVSLAPDEPAALLQTPNDEGEASRWSLCALNAGTGYATALAVEGHDWRLSCWQFSMLEYRALPN